MLSFRLFDMEADPTCRYDYLDVYNGHTRLVQKLGRFCGTFRPGALISTSNTMMLEMVSDDATGGRGFLASFNAGKPHVEGVDMSSLNRNTLMRLQLYVLSLFLCWYMAALWLWLKSTANSRKTWNFPIIKLKQNCFSHFKVSQDKKSPVLVWKRLKSGVLLFHFLFISYFFLLFPQRISSVEDG